MAVAENKEIKGITVKDVVYWILGILITVVGFFLQRTISTIETKNDTQDERLKAIEIAVEVNKQANSQIREVVEIKLTGFSDKLTRIETKIDGMDDKKRK